MEAHYQAAIEKMVRLSEATQMKYGISFGVFRTKPGFSDRGDGLEFWSFGTRLDPVPKGTGKAILTEITQIADEHQAPIWLWCDVQKLIVGMYQPLGWETIGKNAFGTTHYMLRKPH